MSDTTCDKFVRPSNFGLRINTSDVNLYDGPNLSCISYDEGDGLNEIIASINSAICALNSAISDPNISSSNVSYNGGTTFDCFTLPGGNLNNQIEFISSKLCDTIDTLNSLAASTLTIGVSFDADCLGTFPQNTPFLDLISAITAELCSVSGTVTTINGTYATHGDTSNTTLGNAFVVTGGTKSTSGLTLSMNAVSRYFVSGKGYDKGIVGNISLTASSDNYVDYNHKTGNYVVTAVTIGNPAPAITGIRLWMLQTNATVVTLATDLRVYGYISSTLLLDNAVTTKSIADGAITGAKMEIIGAATTLGDSDLISIAYDKYGRVTGGNFNIDLIGLTAGGMLEYDGSVWNVVVPSFVDGSGSVSRVPRLSASSTISDSTIRDDGTTSAFNASLNSDQQVAMVSNLTYGHFVTMTGATSAHYGYYGTSTGATSNNIGAYFQAVGSLAGITPSNTQIGVVGTAATLNSTEAYGARFGVDADPAASGHTVGLYAKASNQGSGTAIGAWVESDMIVNVSAISDKDPAAAFQVDSTTKGILFPRMSATQASAIASPPNGLVVYVNTTNGTFTSVGFWGYQNSAWDKL